MFSLALPPIAVVLIAVVLLVATIILCGLALLVAADPEGRGGSIALRFLAGAFCAGIAFLVAAGWLLRHWLGG